MRCDTPTICLPVKKTKHTIKEIDDYEMRYSYKHEKLFRPAQSLDQKFTSPQNHA